MGNEPDESTTSANVNDDLNGATRREAKFFVRNYTGKRIKELHVYRKHSDNSRHHDTWTDVGNGAKTSEATVEFNAGPLTTGRGDYWLVTWVDVNDQFFFSDPKSVGEVTKEIQKASRWMWRELANAWSREAPSSGTEIIRLFRAISLVVFMPMLKSSSTSEFAQHTLREEDVERPTEIMLEVDNTITFKSQSGKSVTKYAKGELGDTLKKLKGSG